jgi:large subunit ribosomal protein L21e
MLSCIQLGDYVDIKVNPSIHKGMPFKAFHGRTGVIFNVTKRAVGVRVNKQVRTSNKWNITQFCVVFS